MPTPSSAPNTAGPAPAAPPSATATGTGGLDTRVGTIDVAVPKLRTGTYFPEWLLERRKRAESALITVVADCYLAGVSTRRMAPRCALRCDRSGRYPQARDDPRHQLAVEVAGQTHGHGPRRTRRTIPPPPARSGGPVHVRLRRRPDHESPRRRARHRRRRPARRRGERRRAPRSPGHARGHLRDRGRMEQLLRRPRRPRPDRPSAWSPPTPTPGSPRRSPHTCRERPGNAAAPTTPPT